MLQAPRMVPISWVHRKTTFPNLVYIRWRAVKLCWRRSISRIYKSWVVSTLKKSHTILLLFIPILWCLQRQRVTKERIRFPVTTSKRHEKGSHSHAQGSVVSEAQTFAELHLCQGKHICASPIFVGGLKKARATWEWQGQVDKFQTSYSLRQEEDPRWPECVSGVLNDCTLSTELGSPGDSKISMCVSVTQSCLTLRDPLDCSPAASSVHGILQARILECHSLLQGIFLTQGLNPCLLNCGEVLYHLNHQGSAKTSISTAKGLLSPLLEY